MRLLSVITLLAAFLKPALADEEVPPPPGVQFLYSANITVGLPINVGAIPAGNVTVIPVIGGALSGPKIAGMCAEIFFLVERRR